MAGGKGCAQDCPSDGYGSPDCQVEVDATGTSAMCLMRTNCGATCLSAAGVEGP